MTEAVRVAVQIQSNRLYDSYQIENDEFLRTIDENMKRIIKEQVKSQVKEQVSRILPRIEQNLYKALVDAYEADKTILDSYGDTVILKRRREDDDDQEEGPFTGSDRGSKRRREGKEPESASAPLETATRSTGRSTTVSKSRQVSASESAFAEEPMQTISQMDEPSYLVFETGADDQIIVQYSQHPECELEKQADSRSSFNELLDTPLDFSNFIMNRLRVDTLTPELLAGPTFDLMKGSCTSQIELEYHLEEVYKATTNNWIGPILKGGASSHKYTTSITKSKAADYENIKWIEDLFYGFAVNRESTLDVYSKRRIIAVTDLKIVEWHSYKHLDWITVRRDDDKLYKFKEGDFKRLRLQDTEDMLLLLLQGNLSNLTKRLNLTKPDTYRSYLKRREAYTSYSNPRVFIYQNKDKKNRLMRIDELYKFSDGMLNDVRNALDGRLKGIRM
nr:hypothetical protein [Tanacetum cinerariifolium]